MQAVGRADQRLLVALRTRGHSPAGDRLVQGLGLFGELGSGWVALGLAGALLRPERRERWLVATGAAPAAILTNYAVKLTIGRERPLIDDHPPLARAPSKLSFPSAHSTSAVAAAVVLGQVSPTARPAFSALAGAICASRPYLGMHYPSDVIAGAALGYALGKLYPLPRDAGNGGENEAERAVHDFPSSSTPSSGQTGREAEDLPGSDLRGAEHSPGGDL